LPSFLDYAFLDCDFDFEEKHYETPLVVVFLLGILDELLIRLFNFTYEHFSLLLGALLAIWTVPYLFVCELFEFKSLIISLDPNPVIYFFNLSLFFIFFFGIEILSIDSFKKQTFIPLFKFNYFV